MDNRSAITALGLENARVIAIIGGGGKSSLMAALGEEFRYRGETAVMTTTTHIRPPRQNGYIGDDAAVLSDLLITNRVMTVGMPVSLVMALHSSTGLSGLISARLL